MLPGLREVETILLSAYRRASSLAKSILPYNLIIINFFGLMIYMYMYIYKREKPHTDLLWQYSI